MRLWQICLKTWREQIRSGWDLILCVTLAPLFILMYWVFLGNGSALPMDIAIVNQDDSAGQAATGGEDLITRLSALRNSDGTRVFRIRIFERSISGRIRHRGPTGVGGSCYSTRLYSGTAAGQRSRRVTRSSGFRAGAGRSKSAILHCSRSLYYF